MTWFLSSEISPSSTLESDFEGIFVDNSGVGLFVAVERELCSGAALLRDNAAAGTREREAGSVFDPVVECVMS